MTSSWYQIDKISLVAVGIGIITKIWFAKTVQDWRRNRKRLIEAARNLPSGPRGFPFIGSAYLFACKTEEILSRVLDKCRPFEGTFCCWLGSKLVVCIKKPEDKKVILQSANASCKDPIMRFAEDLFGRGILTSSGPTQKVHRRMFLTMLNGKTVSLFVNYFEKHCQRCVERLEDHVGIGEFNIHSYMERCAVDSALDIIMGTPGITQQNGHKKLMESVARMVKIWLHPNWIYACTKYKKMQDEAKSVIQHFVKNLVAEKKKEYLAPRTGSEVSNTQRLRLLKQLVAHNEQTNLMEDDQLRDEILTVFIAAQDSTTNASSFVLMTLEIHPEIQEKVRSELFEVLGEGSLTEKNLSKLQYLSIVIKETLRLFPIGPLLARKLTGDVHLRSHTLPEGCTVVLMPFLAHRDPEYWVNPDTFDPERFTPENSVGRHPYAYVPFSGGTRGCIGKRYAELYIKTVVANVLRKYRLSSSMSTLDDLKLKSDIVLRSVNGYKISISRL